VVLVAFGVVVGVAVGVGDYKVIVLWRGSIPGRAWYDTQFACRQDTQTTSVVSLFSMHVHGSNVCMHSVHRSE
jgi:hypothetical protein